MLKFRGLMDKFYELALERIFLGQLTERMKYYNNDFFIKLYFVIIIHFIYSH